jgi:hypothetical protein
MHRVQKSLIAGPVLALLLKRSGFDAQVFEASSGPPTPSVICEELFFAEGRPWRASRSVSTACHLLLDESQQVCIDLLGIRCRHASPCITSTGTVIFLRSSVKSVCENATMPS